MHIINRQVFENDIRRDNVANGNTGRVTRELGERLAQVESVLFITGAGVSADSGLPTYRGVGGLYHDQSTEDGVAIEDALSGSFFADHPEVTWKYLRQIEAACRGATFNRAHEVLAAFENALPRVWVLTQNVDGLHKAAGSRQVIDIHGDLHELICTSCPCSERVETYGHLAALPRCRECGEIVRPNVVLFGELLATEKLERLEAELERGFDAVISIGTSSLFPYISRPVLFAARQGKITAEINPGATDLSALVDYRMEEGAAASLDAIWRSFEEVQRSRK